MRIPGTSGLRCSATTALLLWAAIASAGRGPLLHISRKVSPETQRDAALEQALLAQVGNVAPVRSPIYYAYNRVRLHEGPEKQVLAFLSGEEECGSGGCEAYVLEEDSGRYKIVADISLAREPIYVSSHRTNGWNDLVLWVSGGGVSGHPAVLQFDGKTYPGNPSTAPAVRLTHAVTVTAYLANEKRGYSGLLLLNSSRSSH